MEVETQSLVLGGLSYWGSHVLPVVYLEVFPQAPTPTNEGPSLSFASVRRQLQKLAIKAMLDQRKEKSRRLALEWLDEASCFCRAGRLTMASRDQEEGGRSNKEPFFFHFRQDHPAKTKAWPCHCIAYVMTSPDNIDGQEMQEVMIHDDTLVRIWPASSTTPGANATDGAMLTPCWKAMLTGEMLQPAPSKSLEEEVLATSNPSTIQELSLRLKLLLSEDVKVRTTALAISNQLLLRHRQRAVRSALSRAFHRETGATVQAASNHEEPTGHSLLLRDRALIVHSAHHGDGKTVLVEILARRYCQQVCVIRPGPLLAKYGIYSDAALETVLHQAVVAAAVKKEAICIILDQLDGFVAPSGSASAGDAAVPVLNAVASYLRHLTEQLCRRREWAFPTKNVLYGSTSCGGGGTVLNVSVCLVAIVTCPDDSAVLNSMVAGRYRLAPLTASCRLGAFRWALRDQTLSTNLQYRLASVAAAAVWARGSAFGKVAREARRMTMATSCVALTEELLERALRTVQRSEVGSAVSYQVQFVDSIVSQDDGLFASVGGNQEAKCALEDALALDPKRRKLLTSLGMSPPTGILLYGPPGTGKTLLAKAVARLLNSRSSSTGGAFVSVSSTDIVRAEVGSGEKMVVSAFETARLNSPAVIFIDEFQALFVARESGGSSRLSTTLLQCMDDIKQWGDIERLSHEEDGRVVVLAATNTPWMIDGAFLRPGRFDRAVHVGLPDFAERQSILLLHVAVMKMDLDLEQLSIVCERLAQQTEGFSGADLAALCRAAAVQCLVADERVVGERHFVMAMAAGIKASSSRKLVSRIQEWHP